MTKRIEGWRPEFPSKTDGRRRPNLFIVGAMKCGTTSLHHYLNQHPDIFMSEPKEPQYLVDSPWYPKDLDWYLELFREAGDAIYAGESSTFYSKLPVYPGVPERISRLSPDARIIYLMRDPIDRIISHYWHMVRQIGEWRPLRHLLDVDVEYLAYSDYALQLEPYLDIFGRDRVYTLTLEAMKTDPQGEVAGVVRWLGLEDQIPEDVYAQRWNALPPELPKARGRAWLHRLRRTRLWDKISSHIPRGVKDVALALTYRRVNPKSVDLSDIAEDLRPHFQRKVAELEELLGRKFPEWVTTTGQTDSRRGGRARRVGTA
ncbi:MAG: sulfotransferase [Anaerolineales bacterium]|nr:sulfotransferase [Anaerolineales bacterium]